MHYEAKGDKAAKNVAARSSFSAGFLVLRQQPADASAAGCQRAVSRWAEVNHQPATFCQRASSQTKLKEIVVPAGSQ